MKLNDSLSHGAQPATQKGMVLIVGLVMVLLLTIIGLAAIRGSGLQESMAANMRDTNVAFQAAESGLRVCENELAPNKSLPATFTCGYEMDLNNTPAQSVLNNQDYWKGLAKEVRISTPNDPKAPNVASQPTALIEKLYTDKLAYGALHGAAIGMQAGKNQVSVDTYRVNVQGVGAANTSKILLQTTYNR